MAVINHEFPIKEEKQELEVFDGGNRVGFLREELGPGVWVSRRVEGNQIINIGRFSTIGEARRALLSGFAHERD
jgi:hypothetical protein